MIRARADECKSAELRQLPGRGLASGVENRRRVVFWAFHAGGPYWGRQTLSGLAFALQHAAEHSLRRVIYVAPFLSILDQNSRVIRDALGVTSESLGLLDTTVSPTRSGVPRKVMNRAKSGKQPPHATPRTRDAPVVVTTNVQFLESLFSNEPGRCRKLHNIARSVVLLDECQAIPNDLLAPTCSMLAQLVDHLGCTIVLATATQPAFDHPELHAQGSGLRENSGQLFRRNSTCSRPLRRMHVTWPLPDEYLDWADVARLMTEAEGRHTALFVVNTRRAARELFQLLKKKCLQDAAFHLSTWMCPAHRLKVLDTVRGAPRCRLALLSRLNSAH